MPYDIVKRKRLVHNGSMWVEVWFVTSSDLVYMANGVDTLDEKIEAVELADTSHITNTTLHLTTLDNTKLGNLATDANATYATKTEVNTHASDFTLHKTTLDNTKLANLPTDALATFATKEMLEGSRQFFIAENIAERNLKTIEMNFGPGEIGMRVMVRDPSADTANITIPGMAFYMWDGDAWEFLYQVSITNLSAVWTDITNGPSSTPAQIDAMVTKAHEHANKAVIDDLGDQAGELTFQSELVAGKQYNHTHFVDYYPPDPKPQDRWIAPYDIRGMSFLNGIPADTVNGLEFMPTLVGENGVIVTAAGDDFEIGIQTATSTLKGVQAFATYAEVIGDTAGDKLISPKILHQYLIHEGLLTA